MSTSKTPEEIHYEFCKNLLGDDVDKTLLQRGFKPGCNVTLAINNNGEPLSVGVAVVSEQVADGRSSYIHTLHDEDLPNFQVVVERVIIFSSVNKMTPAPLYPYPFDAPDSVNVPKTLADLDRNGQYAWDYRAMVKLLSNSSRRTKTTDRATSLPDRMNFKTTKKSTKKLITVSSDEENEDVDEIEETPVQVHPLFNDKEGKKAKLRPFNIKDYTEFEILAYINQIEDYDNPLRIMDPKHRDKDLLSIIEDDHFDYSVGMLTIGSLNSITQDSSGLSTLFKRLPGDIFRVQLKDDQKLTVMDGRHRRSKVSLISQTKEKDHWSNQLMRFNFIQRKDNNALQSWEITSIGEWKNCKATKAKTDTRLDELLYKILNYSKTLEEKYRLTFMESNINFLAKDMENMRILGEIKYDTYKKYIRLAKVCLQDSQFYNFIKYDFMDVIEDQTTNRFISYLDEGILLTASESDRLLMLRACVHFIKENLSRNYRDRKAFQATKFYSAARSYITQLKYYVRKLQNSKSDISLPQSLDELLYTEYKALKTAMSTVENTVFNNLMSFNFDSGKLTSNYINSRIRKLTSKLDDWFFPNMQENQPEPPPDLDIINIPDNNSSTGSNSGKVVPSRRRRRNQTQLYNPYQTDPKRHKPSPSTKNKESEKPKPKPKPKGSSSTTTSAKPPQPPIIKTTTETSTAPSNDGFNDVVNEIIPAAYQDQYNQLKNEWPSKNNVQFMRITRVHSAFQDMNLGLFNNIPFCPASAEDPTPFLRSAFISHGHRASLFFRKEEVLFLRKMAWAWGAYGQIRIIAESQGQNCDPTHLWKTTVKLVEQPIGLSFFAAKTKESAHKGYCMFEGMADPLRIPEAVKSDFDPPTRFPQHSLQELWDFVEATFPGQDNLQIDESTVHWSPIINTGNAEVDKNNDNIGNARFTTTNEFLTRHLESTPELLWTSVRRAALDLWIGWLLALMDLDHNGEWPSFFPCSGGRFLNTANGCLDQTGHNDFPVTPGTSPGFFVIVTARESARLWTCQSSHKYVFYSDEDKRKMADLLVMTEVTIPPVHCFRWKWSFTTCRGRLER